MYPEPRLVGPIIGSLAAAFCFWIGRYVIPEQYQIARVLFVMIGGVCLFFALAGFIDWAVYKFGGHLKNLIGVKDSLKLELAREIRMMNRDQLRLYERVGPFEAIGYWGSGKLRWMLYTSMGNIPMSWIGSYLDKCSPRYPYMVPQHGMPDILERDYVKWFTAFCVQNGIAEKPIGNRPARWLKPLPDVSSALGLEEE